MSDKPKVKLVERDGSAFFIMASCKNAAKKAGWSNEKIDSILKEMKSGDYDNLLITAMKYFEVD